MTITNLKWKSPITKTEYILDGEIKLYTNTGFNFVKLTKINGIENDNTVLKSFIKHEDILNHLKKNKIS
jgi:hypothetical protein